MMPTSSAKAKSFSVAPPKKSNDSTGRIVMKVVARERRIVSQSETFATIANVSLWETIRRSLAPTFITILPVLSLLFFGGATLKDFAFALLVGIISGAYSSIFIAAPLLTIWKEREPEYARRKEQPPAA